MCFIFRGSQQQTAPLSEAHVSLVCVIVPVFSLIYMRGVLHLVDFGIVCQIINDYNKE